LNRPDQAEPEKPFDAPWQAKAFAIAVHLSERGLFSWPEWTEAFTQIAKDRPPEAGVSEAETYWRNWIDALEHFIVQRAQSRPELITELSHEWHRAFERTPHGEPVSLEVELAELVDPEASDRTAAWQD